MAAALASDAATPFPLLPCFPGDEGAGPGQPGADMKTILGACSAILTQVT